MRESTNNRFKMRLLTGGLAVLMAASGLAAMAPVYAAENADGPVQVETQVEKKEEKKDPLQESKPEKKEEKKIPTRIETGGKKHKKGGDKDLLQ